MSRKCSQTGYDSSDVYGALRAAFTAQGVLNTCCMKASTALGTFDVHSIFSRI